MKILKIIHGFPPLYSAGSEVYSHSIVEELSKRHEVLVFTREENVFEPDFRFRTEKREKYNVIYVNMARAKDGYNHQLINQRFANLVDEFKPEVAHIGHLNHLSTGIVDVLYEKKIPIVYTLHDYWLMCPRGQFLQRNFDGKNLYQLCDGQDNYKCATTCYRMYFSGYERKFDSGLWHIHGLTPPYDTYDEIQLWTRWIETRQNVMRDIVKKVNLFIAPSRYLMNRYIKDFDVPKEKIIYLDYGFPLHYLRPVKHKQNDVFTFGYIGRIIPAKGIDLLIRAFKKIKEPSRLKIWGIDDGQTLKALKRLAQDSPNPIEFCGQYVNKNLAETVFSKVDVIVVPSIWVENSPLVIHEAQACRIPVITADAGGMAEYVKHKVNGLLFKFRNEQSLYEQMLWALNNQEQIKKLGQRGYLYSPDGKVPDIEEHTKKLEKVYFNVERGNEEWEMEKFIIFDKKRKQ